MLVSTVVADYKILNKYTGKGLTVYEKSTYISPKFHQVKHVKQ